MQFKTNYNNFKYIMLDVPGNLGNFTKNEKQIV